MRTRGLALLLALSACSGAGEPTGVDPASFAGSYGLVTVDGRPLSTTVSDSWLHGAITSGSLLVDEEWNFWMRLVTVADGRREVLTARGLIGVSEQGEVVFLDLDGATL